MRYAAVASIMGLLAAFQGQGIASTGCWNEKEKQNLCGPRETEEEIQPNIHCWDKRKVQQTAKDPVPEFIIRREVQHYEYKVYRLGCTA